MNVRLPATLEVLRDRNLARYAGATAVSALGTGMADVALAFAILGLAGPTELGVTFDPVPAHTRGVGSYGGDEVLRQERPTPVHEGGAKKKRRRRGRRGGRDRGAPPPA